MSFTSWLRNFRSGLAPSRSQCKHRREKSLRTASHRLHLELLEDRCVPAMYAVTELGTLGGTLYGYGSAASDLNQASQVVGWAYTADGFNHAFLSENGTMIDLGTLGGSASIAEGINDVGQVVGRSLLPDDGAEHAFLVNPQGGVWFQDSDLDGRNDFMMDLGTLNGSAVSEAYDINNAGQVAGQSAGRAFLWDAANGMTDLGAPLGAEASWAFGINNAGQVTGVAWYYDPQSGDHFSAFLWDAANGMTALNAGPTYTESQAAALNDAGQVVGYQCSASIDPAFLWTPDSPNGLTGSFTDLGMLPGTIGSNATAINNAGQVVGSSTSAFFWDAAGGMVDLQTQVAPGSDATLQAAVAINDGGFIAVNGYNGGGEFRAFLLTPIPPDTPSISIADAPAVMEGNTGTVNATFTVSLSFAYAQPITVHYQTADASATAGSDYVAASGDVTFDAGVTSLTIPVAVIGDRSAEPNETFIVNLTTRDAYFDDGQGLATILDDEPSVRIDDVTVTEGDSGTVNATFTVVLSAACDRAVGVQYETADQTALAGSDYQAAGGTVTFAAGETTRTIAVIVNGDTLGELDEIFVVNLSSVDAHVADGQGTGTIVGDEPAFVWLVPLPEIASAF